jgi:hypothetical protein
MFLIFRTSSLYMLINWDDFASNCEERGDPCLKFASLIALPWRAISSLRIALASSIP